MELRDVLNKHFRDERTLYFSSSDRLRQLEDDTYLRYRLDGGVELYFGGANGEVCILFTQDPDKLDSIIKMLIYA